MKVFIVLVRNLFICCFAVLLFAMPACYAQKEVTAIKAETPESAAPKAESKIPEGEAAFTAAELKEYYQVYDNADVKHLRKIFDKYLANAKARDEDESAEFSLLKGIDNSYYKSKFTVLSRNPDTFGNTHIMLLFSDKPDAVFKAVIYTGNGNRLRAFEADATFSEEDIRRIQIRYRKFIEDKKHSM